MYKQEFLEQLKSALSGYPQEETAKSLAYYAEMIEDRIEDGIPEEEAVNSLGSVESIVKQIKSELPMGTLVKTVMKEKAKERRVPVWAIVLLVIGSPLWLGILMMGFGMLLTLYALVWVFDIFMWCMVLLAACAALTGILGTAVSLFHGAVGSALIYLGSLLFCVGVGIFLWVASLQIAKGIIRGTKMLFLGLKRRIAGNRSLCR